MAVRTLALLACTVALAGDDADAPRKAAIRRAFDYLEGNLFRLPDAAGTPRKPFTFAVAGLDYLMAGQTRTPGASPVTKIRDYLVDYVRQTCERLEDPRSLPPRHGLASSEFVVQYTWPFAVAGLFFAELELRGMATAESRRALDRIVAALAAAQDPGGGWGHGRVAAGAKPSGYPPTLVSATNVVAIAVGLLDAAGRRDTAPVVERARAYLRAARLDNGSFPYDPSQRQSGFAMTNVGRTAGSLFAWHCLGMPRDGDFRGSVDYLTEHFDRIAEGHGSPCLNVMQGALLCRLLGRAPWARFREMYERRLLQAQAADGALGCICEGKEFGVTCDDQGGLLPGPFVEGQRCYTTALHLFALLLDRDALEIVKRRKPAEVVTTPR